MVAGGIDEFVSAVEAANDWSARIAQIRRVPAEFGNAQQPAVYSALADRLYVSALAPDFAYVHWRDEYDLAATSVAYDLAHRLTHGFTAVDAGELSGAIHQAPQTLRIFRLLLGFTTQEFAASTQLTAAALNSRPLTNAAVKSVENGHAVTPDSARVAAAVIDQAMRGVLYPAPEGELRSKLDKPDTRHGWETVREYASQGVPLSVFLHQRHYGGAFRQLLDATSGRRGDLLEQAVEDVFRENEIGFLRTGPSNHAVIAERFGLTVRPAPDFVVYDSRGALRALLECKQANDGGTARDKAARFATLKQESVRLGGVPLFAVLAGLGWRRTSDTLGPVVRDTDGRVFTVQTLARIMDVEPFLQLKPS